MKRISGFTALTDEKIRAERRVKWRLLEAMRHSLYSNHKSVSLCSKSLSILNLTRHVGIYKSLEHNKTFYTGLSTCSSVWICPLCSSKISERRKTILETLHNYYLSEKKNRLSFVTLTLPHSRETNLVDFLRSFRYILSRLLSSGRFAKRFKKYIFGYTRVWEVTWSHKNGWHPHVHIVFYHNDSVAHSDFVDLLKAEFIRLAESRGFVFKTYDRCIDARNGDFAASYVSKFGRQNSWTAAAELTKQNVKKSRAGFNPFELAAVAYLDEPADISSDYAKKLHLEYANCFKGVKQLQHSKSISDILKQLELDKSDSELVSEIQDNAVLLCYITDVGWWEIRRKNLVTEVLDNADVLTRSDFLNYLDALGIEHKSELPKYFKDFRHVP